MGDKELQNSDNYFSIAEIKEGLYKENGSRFLAIAHPCTSVEQANEIIGKIKKKYHDATHHCYAYRIGCKGEIFRLNDDGEPSSTAGKPIYGEILSSNLSDILVVVVRWFGGVKLGVPGLIKAYKGATKEALNNCTIITKVATTLIKILFPYPQTDRIIKELKKIGVEGHNKSFLEECSMEAYIPITKLGQICTILNSIDGVTISDLGRTSINK